MGIWVIGYFHMNQAELSFLRCDPVTDMGSLRRVYELIEEACRRVQDREGIAYFAPQVYADIVAGNLVLFVVYDGPEEVGLFTCHQQMDSRAGVPKLVVQLAYILPGQPDEIMQTGLERCRVYAQELGCRRIRFHAVRKGWSRKAARLGYRLVEYVYERGV